MSMPRFLTACAAFSAVTLLASCAEPASEKGGVSDNSAASGEKTTITVYTSEPEEKVDEINAAFMEANPDIEVESTARVRATLTRASPRRRNPATSARMSSGLPMPPRSKSMPKPAISRNSPTSMLS